MNKEDEILYNQPDFDKNIYQRQRSNDRELSVKGFYKELYHQANYFKIMENYEEKEINIPNDIMNHLKQMFADNVF
jgi:hypothetical protein